MDDLSYLKARVGILENALSTLLSYLRESSDTAEKYNTYKSILDTAMEESNQLVQQEEQDNGNIKHRATKGD